MGLSPKLPNTEQIMPSCAVTDGYKQNTCPTPTPGAYQAFYVANLADIVSWTGSGTANEYNAITFGAGKGLYKWQVQRDTVVLREERQDEDGTTNYTHEATFRVMDMGIEARNRIDELNGVDVVVIGRTKADTFEIIGFENGARLALNVRTTEGAEVGHTVTIRAINQPGLAPHFLDTDVATTLATLEGYVVGS